MKNEFFFLRRKNSNDPRPYFSEIKFIPAYRTERTLIPVKNLARFLERRENKTSLSSHCRVCVLYEAKSLGRLVFLLPTARASLALEYWDVYISRAQSSAVSEKKRLTSEFPSGVALLSGETKRHFSRLERYTVSFFGREREFRGTCSRQTMGFSLSRARESLDSAGKSFWRSE